MKKRINISWTATSSTTIQNLPQRRQRKAIQLHCYPSNTSYLNLGMGASPRSGEQDSGAQRPANAA
jgi:hypothetical protein